MTHDPYNDHRHCPLCGAVLRDGWADDGERHRRDDGTYTCRTVEEGYENARRLHGDDYADYLIRADAEHAAKGYVPVPWPLSLQGNDGD